MRDWVNLSVDISAGSTFSAKTINRLGYSFLDKMNPAKAIEVFQLYVEAYPGDANAYDSLAEAYMMAGEVLKAARNYRQSLVLDPANDNAIKKLRELEARME